MREGGGGAAWRVGQGGKKKSGVSGIGGGGNISKCRANQVGEGCVYVDQKNRQGGGGG